MNPESATPFKVRLVSCPVLVLLDIPACSGIQTLTGWCETAPPVLIDWPAVSGNVFQSRNTQVDPLMIHSQVFLAKVLNHLMPSLTLGSIQSKWVSRDKKQVSVVKRCAGF